ncbi:MAG: 2-amino-4-hydroxy-6-hydroxymethyldihydropteridine diphosphokinase [Candidatus Thioglobus sp.]|nr:2-amino-4-hydroxy-6-hydroxymethyldihydropteridine diphosphokinase [Candidatus Neomarinimicrobiota bacterium]MDP7554019.1 2-amino-4-hydroxy-6-hydroxymethyldihydropteridine diphosphokinase [Candidatus Thioglobus sp.]
MLAFIGLGSNLQGPRKQINTALNSLDDLSETKVLRISGFYQSKPLLEIPGPDYLNVVCKIETRLSALDLLSQCQQIENKQHRVREIRWGSRTIDLDILVYGDEVISTKELIVPHPEMIKRNFVLLPLFEIEPELELPIFGKLKDLVAKVESSSITKL